MPRTPEPWTPIRPPLWVRALCILAAAVVLAPCVVYMALGGAPPHLGFFLAFQNLWLLVVLHLCSRSLRVSPTFSMTRTFIVQAEMASLALVFGLLQLFLLYMSQVTST